MSKDEFPARLLALRIVAVLACLVALPGLAHAQQTSLRASVVVVPRPEPVELSVAPSATADGSELEVTAPRSWRWQVERVRAASSGERVVLGTGSGSSRLGVSRISEAEVRSARSMRSGPESARSGASDRAAAPPRASESPSASPPEIVYTLAPI